MASLCQLRLLCHHWILTLVSLLTGSHTVLCLLEHGYHVTIIDNLDNAFEEAYRCASSTINESFCASKALVRSETA